MVYSPEQIRSFLMSSGMAGPNGNALDPAGIYAAARQYGVAPGELDAAMGWNPGDAQNWINQRGLATTDPGTTTQGTVSLANAPVPVNAASSAGVTPFSAQQAAGPAPMQAQQAANPYIGATTQGIGASPYLGQTGGTVNAQRAGVVNNQMAGMNNPYLTSAIDNASQDAIRNYNLGTAPQRQTQMQQSGAFGNTGVQQMQLEDQRNLQNTLGNIATNVRMADYSQQLGVAENAAARGTAMNQFNAGQDLIAQQFNVGARQSDLARNLGAANQVGMFNAGLQQADLARNTNAALGLGTFNAGQANNMAQFGANLGQQNNQFNAGAQNQTNQYLAGLNQSNNQFNAGAANQVGMFNNSQAQGRNIYNAGAQNQGRQFNENLDYNIYQGNVNAANNAMANQNNYLAMLMGLQGQGYNMANNMYMQPLSLYGQFANTANAFGGQGGVQSQNTQGNPMLGMFGGYQIGQSLYNQPNRTMDTGSYGGYPYGVGP